MRFSMEVAVVLRTAESFLGGLDEYLEENRHHSKALVE